MNSHGIEWINPAIFRCGPLDCRALMKLTVWFQGITQGIDCSYQGGAAAYLIAVSLTHTITRNHDTSLFGPCVIFL